MSCITTEKRHFYDTSNESTVTVKNCRLCCNEFDQKTGLSYNQKLADSFCKYLHSSLTQELSIGSDDPPLCSRCSVTGMEIIALSDQMNSIQKSLSELVFMFSLEILHCRGKTLESQGIPGRKLIEFDVSSLPNCECWDNPSPEVDTATSSGQNIIPENVYIQNAEDRLYDVSIGEIKSETNDYGLDFGNEEVTEARGTNHNTIDRTDTELSTKTEELTTSEDAVENSESSTPEQDQQLTPILILQKLEIHGGGKQLIADEHMNRMVLNNNPLRRSKKSVWTKMDSGSRFKLTQQNSEALTEQWGDQLNSLPLHRISTEESKTSEESLSTFSFKNRSWDNNIASTNKEEHSKEKPRKRNFYKYLKKQTGKISQNSQKLGHLADKPLCSQTFMKSQGLSDHRRHHHPKGEQFKCMYCPKNFTRKYYLIRHIRTHTGEKPYSGLICHQRLYHSKGKLFRCTFCTKEFLWKSSFTSHLRSHTGERPFRCDKCDYSSAHLQGLIFHKNRRHGDANYNNWIGRIYQCTHCPKRFPSKCDLVRHVRTHTGEKPYSCDKCDYSATQLDSVRVHQNRRHSNAGLNFQCGECGDKFKLSIHVKQHFKRIHRALEFSDDCVIATN